MYSKESQGWRIDKDRKGIEEVRRGRQGLYAEGTGHNTHPRGEKQVADLFSAVFASLVR